MSKQLIYPSIVILTTLFITSCGDDPELVRKREEQRTEIRKLEGDLSLLQEQLKDAPKDRSSELEELKERIESERAQITQLEKEVADLETEKRELDREFEAYKQKYRVR
jgi:peptidoglycan hydrolase CwlO-like protein